MSKELRIALLIGSVIMMILTVGNYLLRSPRGKSLNERVAILEVKVAVILDEIKKEKQ